MTRPRHYFLAAAAAACFAWAMLHAAAARAVVLDVPVDRQNNLTSSCGSCGSSSTAMALAYLGRAHSADWIERWLYARLPCCPGPDLLAARARDYCATYLGLSGCASNAYWSSGNALANLTAQINAGRPFVASTYWPFSSGTYPHYVTVVGIENGYVYVNEPARGERQAVPWSTFNARWAANSYRVVIFHFGCAHGAVQSRPCCDCGTQTRTCDHGVWGGWSACAGSDPDGGSRVCDTGELGPCAEGRVRCIEGCTACVRIYEPRAELCDTVDNDCNGLVNDGGPTEMGDPPPPYAAMMVDASFAPSGSPEEPSQVWADFMNLGTEPWPAGQAWLASLQALEGETSDLYAEGSWPAWNVAAVNSLTVAPGDTFRFAFDVHPRGAPGDVVSETFHLVDPEGELVVCPVPAVEVSLTLAGDPPDDGFHGAAQGPAEDADLDSTRGFTGGSSCSLGLAGSRRPGAAPSMLLAFLLALLGLLRRGR